MTQRIGTKLSGVFTSKNTQLGNLSSAEKKERNLKGSLQREAVLVVSLRNISPLLS